MNVGSPELLIVIMLGSLFFILKKAHRRTRDRDIAINANKNEKQFPLLTDSVIIIVVTLLLITSSGCTTKEPTTVINNNATQISVEKSSNSPIASEQIAAESSSEEITLTKEKEISAEETSVEETRATKPEIEIIHPVEETHWQENIGGIARNIPDGYQLWVLVYSQEKEQYYPYAKVVPQYGEWVIPVTIGFKSDSYKKFDILAVLADKDAQDRFNAYLDTVEENDENIYSQGIYLIPDGAKEYSRITLTRRSQYNDNTVT